ncbi:MAG: homoserine dehydrogenase, partial [Oscillospiraceae bacterium]
IAFGRHIYPNQVQTEGITKIALADVNYAERAGYKIKLLGRAIRQKDGKVCIFVAPHLVPVENPLSGVEDVFNAITVKGDAIGDVMFYGRGAGKLPTASAVVADVIDAAKHINTKKYLDWGPGGDDVAVPPSEMQFRFYLRCGGSAETLQKLLPGATVIAGGTEAEGALLTGETTLQALENQLSGVEILSLIRVLD